MKGQQYDLSYMVLAIQLILTARVSFRAASAVLMLICEGRVPVPSTIRSWVLRLGLGMLRQNPPRADDWAWLVDHSIQIGTQKCLVILGIRLSDYPWGRGLRHDDMTILDLTPMNSSTAIAVKGCLDSVAARVGVPRVIVNDHGSDLCGAVRLFRTEHPRVAAMYDLKHKAACILKRRLTANDRWSSFASEAGKTKALMQQTEMAPLVPNSQRSKARFMNVEPLVNWGRKTLAWLETADPQTHGMSRERVEKALGWLRGYRAELVMWSQTMGTIGAVLEEVRDWGLTTGMGDDLSEVVPTCSGLAGEVRAELIEFVTEQAEQAKPGERLPISTEVLESFFGKLKSIEQDQSKSGFSGLILSLGALTAERTPEEIGPVLEQTRWKAVMGWCKEKLGATIQSLRRRIYAPPRAQQKSDQQ